MRLIFFGSGEFGLPTLKKLVEEHEVARVVTQPDRPAGRHRTLTPTPIAEFAASKDIAVIKPEQVNDPSVVSQIRALSADAFVVIAFGQKLGVPLLENVFAVNLHGSLLPKYRGAAPIQRAMMQGERETGLSVITLAQRMDAGEILSQVSTPIDPLETAGELHDRLAGLGPDVILRVLDQFQSDSLQSKKQDERQVFAAPKLAKSDGTVRFDQTAESVRAHIHGLTPWPGCTIKLDGRPIRLHRVEAVNPDARHEDLGVIQPDRSIACAAGEIQILEIQPPGGKLMSFAAYCNGQPVLPGMRCEPL